MNNSMGFVLAAFLLCLLVFRRVMLNLTRRKIMWYQDPVMLFSGTWLIQSITYALPVFENRESLEGQHVLYILMCHVAFFIGVLLVPHARPKGDGPAADPLQINVHMLAAVGLIGLLGNFAVAYDGLHISSVGLAQRFTSEGFELARRERFKLSSGGWGPLLSLEFLAAATTIFVCMMTAGVAQRLSLKRWQLRSLAALAVVSVAFVAFNTLVIHGGRLYLVLLLMGACLGALIDPRRSLLRYIDQSLGRAKGAVYTLLIAALLATVWFFATTFVKGRIGDDTPPLVSLYQYHRASPTPEVLDMVEGDEVLQYALLSFSYVTVPLSTLVYYYDMPKGQFPGPYWGQYNFAVPATFAMRRMGMVRDQKTVGDIRDEATRHLRVMGYGDNVWSTLLRDLALDVSWTGVPIVLLLLGWGAEMIMRGARQDGNFIIKVLGLLTAVLLVFSIAHSLLILDTFQKAFWFCFALIIYGKIFNKNKKARVGHEVQDPDEVGPGQHKQADASP